jgi:hypothetical protein
VGSLELEVNTHPGGRFGDGNRWIGMKLGGQVNQVPLLMISNLRTHRRTYPAGSPGASYLRRVPRRASALTPVRGQQYLTLKPYRCASNWLTLPHMIIRVVYKTALRNYQTCSCKMATQISVHVHCARSDCNTAQAVLMLIKSGIARVHTSADIRHAC